MTLTDEQLDWLLERIPDPPRSPEGGQPPVDKRKVIQGILWILDNGATWKDLPRRFGAKSTVHRWFEKWVQEGLFEAILRNAGHLVETRDGYRLYERFIDGTFSKARGGGDGIGCTRVGKGVKIMVLVDARGLPAAVDTMPANAHESRLVQHLFDFMLTEEAPERLIGDKAYDSDELDAYGSLLAQPDRIAPDGCAKVRPGQHRLPQSRKKSFSRRLSWRSRR